jgi:hypothetical protein
LILTVRSSHSAHQPAQEKSVGLPAIGSTAEVNLAFYGCEKSGDLSRIVELIRQDDALGAARYAQLHWVDLKEGSKGVVEDTSHWSMQVCLRPVNKYRCYWTRREMLTDYNTD